MDGLVHVFALYTATGVVLLYQGRKQQDKRGSRDFWYVKWSQTEEHNLQLCDDAPSVFPVC